jgi:hypothetical protein
MEDVLSPVNSTGWPARASWGRGHFIPGAVMAAGSDSGLRLALALAGYHRDRRGCGAGCLRSPGNSPERNRGHCRQQDEGQRNVRRHQVLHSAPPQLSDDDRCGRALFPAAPPRLVRDEPPRARASALARTTSRSRGSSGRSSGQRRSRRILDALVRMRFIAKPAVCAGREPIAPAVFGDRPAQVPVRRTPRRPPRKPSAFGRPRSQGDRRTPVQPAPRTPGRRRHAWLPRRLSGPDRRWVHRSAAASTRTRRRPRPRWCRDGT